MANEHHNSFKKILVTGLLVLIPLAATILVLIFLFNLLDGWLAPAGGKILRTLGIHVPPDLQHIPGFGILATFLLTFFTGLVASNYLGRKLLQFGDRLIRRIPVVNSIYSAMRQVVNSISRTGTQAFKTVVLFEFPCPGIWAIGFVTTASLKTANRIAQQELVNVFLPTTPNPTTGFFLMLPRKKLKVLPISPEEGIKIIATAGLIQNEKTSLAGKEPAKPTLTLSELPGSQSRQHPSVPARLCRRTRVKK